MPGPEVGWDPASLQGGQVRNNDRVSEPLKEGRYGVSGNEATGQVFPLKYRLPYCLR